jgi:predicted DsbA family dithiol-disulfide isomerase
MSQDHRIAVVHFTAPTCWWSWGYEPIFNRLRLVYGDQLDLVTVYGTVYEDVEEYKKNYELDDAGMVAWAKEAKDIMGLPMHTDYDFDRMPRSMLPATLAVMAGNRQGYEKGHRLYRALLRRSIVEGQDVTDEATVFDAVREAALDGDRFRSDWVDQASLQADLEKQGESAPPVHVGFYNIAVTDGRGRSVYLDQQFHPSAAEGAIDYLAENRLRKTKPTDILAYLEAHGPTPLVEMQRVFDIDETEALAKLKGLEGLHNAKRSMLAGEPFWTI